MKAKRGRPRKQVTERQDVPAEAEDEEAGRGFYFEPCHQEEVDDASKATEESLQEEIRALRDMTREMRKYKGEDKLKTNLAIGELYSRMSTLVRTEKDLHRRQNAKTEYVAAVGEAVADLDKLNEEK